MKKYFFLLVVLISYCSYSQELISELNGFRIGQFREAPTSELKKPIMSKTLDDGFEYEIFIIKPDSTAYMIFEYPNWATEIIWSIQFYGDDTELNPHFKNLNMGISKEELIKKIGAPSNIMNVGQYGELLEYENTNYSFEINPKNRLSSIKIRDIYSQYYPAPSDNDSPSLSDMLTAFKGDNRSISAILSPSLEIHKNNEVMFFKNAWHREIEKDLSGIYSIIKQSTVGLEKVDTSKVEEYEENMRITETGEVFIVFKFKKHKYINELVMRWEQGAYLLWEIKLN